MTNYFQPRSFRDKLNGMLEKILKMKKSYLVIGLLAIFLVAGFASALSTLLGKSDNNAKPSETDDNFQVISGDPNKEDGDGSEGIPSDTSDPQKTANKKTPESSPTSGKTPFPGVQISLNVSSENDNTSNKAKVTYSLKVKWQSQEAEKIFKNGTVSFYTGSRSSNSFPSHQVGNANLGGSNECKVQFEQAAGNYIAAAVLTGFGGIKTTSPLVPYSINEVETKKPTLKFKVDIKNITIQSMPDNGLLSPNPNDFKNVTYTLFVEINADQKKQLQNSQKTRVDFYTGPQNGSSPSQYVGSTVLANNQTSFTFHQEAGKYRGIAIWADTPWGKLSSNILNYTVQKMVIPTMIKPTMTKTPVPTPKTTKDTT